MAWRVPHVPVLLAEGFPAAVWPAKGRFVTVPGASGQPAPVRPHGTLSAGARELFDASGGRAMLVDQGGQITGSFGPGHGPEDRFISYSMVKSLVGLLVLRAVAEGRIAGLDTPLADLIGTDAPDQTLRQALDMSGGLTATSEPVKSDGDEGYSPFSALGRMHVYGPEAALTDLWIDPARAGTFHYQSANTALLGMVLEAAYDRPLPEVLSRELWAPAGAAPAQWRQSARAEAVSAYCCLYARAEDWLRVGRYLLRNGTADAPFLPDALWQEAFLPDLPAADRATGAYRFHMRHDVLDRSGAAVQGPFAYFMGHGGQVLYIVPGADAVVVRFGEAPQLLHSTLYETLEAEGGHSQ